MKLELKSVTDVQAKLREMIHRAGERFVKGATLPKPENCAHAAKLGTKVQPCSTCGAKPGESCKIESQFEARYTFPELKQMFRELLEKREWLLRNHRDIAMLLWVLNQLDPQEEPDPPPLPAYPVQAPLSGAVLDGDVLHLSPALASQVTTIIIHLKDKPTDEVLEGSTLGHQAGTAPGRADQDVPEGDGSGQDQGT